MVRLELMSITNKKVVYRYYPESTNDFGVLSLDRQNQSLMSHESPDGYHSSYFRHALAKVREWIGAGVQFPERYTVAWY